MTHGNLPAQGTLHVLTDGYEKTAKLPPLDADRKVPVNLRL